MTCKNLCVYYKPEAIKNSQKKYWPKLNIRWCKNCDIRVQWHGGITKVFKKDFGKWIDTFVTKYHCPCCGAKMRTRGRFHRNKEKNS